MDSIDNKNDHSGKSNRTVCVGNLHPNVTYKVIAELFYQVRYLIKIHFHNQSIFLIVLVFVKVGPIEYIEFVVDIHKLCENYAWIVFKHSCSVKDSIKLFCGTKLYGWKIVTKNCSKQTKNADFYNQLKYYKSSKYQHNSKSHNLGCISKHNHLDESPHRNGNCRISIDHNISSSMKVSNNDQYPHNQSYDSKPRDYNVQILSNWNESTQHNHKHFFMNRNNFSKNTRPVSDLNYTMYQKCSILDYNKNVYNNIKQKNKDNPCHENNYTSNKTFNESNTRHRNN